MSFSEKKKKLFQPRQVLFSWRKFTSHILQGQLCVMHFRIVLSEKLFDKWKSALTWTKYLKFLYAVNVLVNLSWRKTAPRRRFHSRQCTHTYQAYVTNKYNVKLFWKNFTGCERLETWSDICRTSLHMTLPEPQRRCDGAKTYTRGIN